MSEEPCTSTPTTPTAKTPTAGLITRFLSRGTAESSKRLIGWQSATVLALIALVLAEAISFRAHHETWFIGGGLLTAFLVVGGYLSWMAKSIFMKPETVDETKPGTTDAGKQP